MQAGSQNEVKTDSVRTVADKVRKLYEQNQTAYQQSLQKYQKAQSNRFGSREPSSKKG